MIRDLILALTIAAIIFIADNRPKPVKTVQVDYCVITYKAARKDMLGEWQTGWATGYGPCSQQDQFYEI